MKKKLLSLFLVLCMLLSTGTAWGLTAFADGEPAAPTPTAPTAADGTLTAQTIEQIVTAGEGTIHLNGAQDAMTLATYANTSQAADGEDAVYPTFAGVTVQLNADLTGNAASSFNALTATAAPANVWTAIQNFAGTFNGGYHTISGIYAESGFFRLLTDGAVVQNVIFANCYAFNDAPGTDGNGFAGIVAARVAGTVALTNVTVENSRTLAAKESGTACVGGLLGGSDEWNGGAAAVLTVTNCSVSGKVGSAATTSTGNSRVGAVIGRIGGTSLSVTDFTNNAAVVGTQYTGGFVGELKVATTMLRCENKATVQGKAFTGGLVGLLSTTASNSFTDCSNSGAITSTVEQACGGLVAKSDSTGAITLTNCSNAGAVNGQSVAGGIIAYVEKSPVTATNLSNTASITSSSSWVGGMFGWLRETKTTVTTATNSGSLTTGGKGGGIVGYVAYGNADVTLDGCVNAASAVLTISAHKGGIVGVVESGKLTVKNSVNHANVSGGGQNGGVLGQGYKPAAVAFENVINNGTVTTTASGHQQGGFVGYLLGNDAATTVFTVKNSVNTANVTANAYVGALVGITENVKTITIDGFTNFGTIDGQRSSGGIGSAKGADGKTGVITFKNAANYGTVKGTSFAGGLIGESFYQNISVDNCANTGAVFSASQPTGGLVGQLRNPVVATSGYAVVMTNVYNSGAISTTILGGGLIGECKAPIYMEDAVNAGSVTTSIANTRTGGLVGTQEGALTSTFKNCLSLGTVSNSNAADSYTGAWVGDIAGTNITTDPTASDYQCFAFENCYFVKNAVNGTKAKNLAFSLSNLDSAGKQFGNVRLVYGETVVDLVGGTVNAELNWDNAVKAYNVPITDGTLPTILTNADDCKGVAAVDTLKSKGFDFGSGWYVTNGAPTPTLMAVAGNDVDTTKDIAYKGYQYKITEGDADTLGIRLVAGVNDLHYAVTGFEVYAIGSIGVACAAENPETETVYTTINQYSEDGNLKAPMTAESLGCTYLSALTVINLPVNMSGTLVVKPYLVGVDGSMIVGTAVALVVVNGTVTAQYAM
ncbi:MAG: hypothetical protein E7668_05760 [Ruminococcaceae bacterium]|nr:hypothetical protein [Oscillospiraceae bacterium]